MPLTESYAIGPTEPPVRDITLGRLLEEAVADAPQRLALIAGTADPAARRQWTYTELHTESLRAARAFRARFEPGERVAIWAPNIPEWVISEFGAARTVGGGTNMIPFRIGSGDPASAGSGNCKNRL